MSAGQNFVGPEIAQASSLLQTAGGSPATQLARSFSKLEASREQ